MIANTKCRKLGGLGKLGVTQGLWKRRHLVDWSAYEFLLAFHGTYVLVLHRF